MTPRILIVDDNAEVAFAVRELLEGQGVTVTGVASNSAEALAAIAEQRPDAVLVDVDLGEESGFDLAERLTPTSGPSWPVVLMSAHDEMELEDLVRRSPAKGFIPKSDISAGAISEVLERGHRSAAD